MIKANELRINNILNYTTAENDILPTTLDWQDIKWISEDPKGFNLVHEPIPLTEEWLLKFGFEESDIVEGLYDIIFDKFEITITCDDNKILDIQLSSTNISGAYLNKEYFKQVHQLQNLYFALTGQELELK